MSELLHAILDIRSWPSNFVYNVNHMFNTSDAKTVVRVVAIIGAYVFIRPYILKFFAYTAMKKPESLEVMDKVLAGEEDIALKVQAKKKMGANAFRDGKTGEGDGEGTGADWGGKARNRAKVVEERKIREEEIKRKYQEGSVEDKDVLDLLVDYEEGEDGWA